MLKEDVEIARGTTSEAGWRMSRCGAFEINGSNQAIGNAEGDVWTMLIYLSKPNSSGDDFRDLMLESMEPVLRNCFPADTGAKRQWLGLHRRT